MSVQHPQGHVIAVLLLHNQVSIYDLHSISQSCDHHLWASQTGFQQAELMGKPAVKSQAIVK